MYTLPTTPRPPVDMTSAPVKFDVELFAPEIETFEPTVIKVSTDVFPYILVPLRSFAIFLFFHCCAIYHSIPVTSSKYPLTINVPLEFSRFSTFCPCNVSSSKFDAYVNVGDILILFRVISSN